MKIFTAPLLAVALMMPGLTAGLAAPAMAQQPGIAQHREEPHRPPQSQNQAARPASQQAYKTFRKGDRFDQHHARNYQVIDYRKYKKLSAPRKGYRYVRAGSDVLLIGTSSFKVYAVYSGLIR